MERWLWGGVEFVGKTTNTATVDQFVIVDRGVKGWDANVSVRRSKAARPWGHGSFESATMYQDRVVTLDGVVQASSPSLLPHHLEALAGLQLGYGWLTTIEHDVARRAWAGLESVKADRVNGWQDRAKFQLTFWCPEPWKYGDERTYSVTGAGNTPVWHMGTVDAAPVIKVAGPFTGPYLELSLAGRKLRLLNPVPAGEVLTINTREGTVRNKAGVSLPARLMGEMLRLPHGAESMFRVSGNGSGRVTFVVEDTFV